MRPPRCPAQLRCPNSHECLQREWLCDGEDDCKDGSDEKVKPTDGNVSVSVYPERFSPSTRTARFHQPSAGATSGSVETAASASPSSGGVTAERTVTMERTRTNVSLYPRRPVSELVSCFYNCRTLRLHHVCIHVTLCVVFLFTGIVRPCPAHLFQCGTGECVDPRLVCNGFINCIDGSDEGPGCARYNCSSQSAPRCDQRCVSTPDGPVGTQLWRLRGSTLSSSNVFCCFLQRCSCAAGFSWNSDALSCVDIDECKEAPPLFCKHICLNTPGSYVCYCHPDFYLEPDDQSCKTKGARTAVCGPACLQLS